MSAAVLDIHLGPDPIDPLCDDLKIRGVPFVFSTGDPEAVSHRWGPVPVVTKPFARSDLIGSLINALVGTSALQQPFESLAPIHEHIFQAQCRGLCQRLVVQRLKTSGVDTAAAEELLRLIQDAAELFRESAKTFSATSCHVGAWVAGTRPVKRRCPQREGFPGCRRELWRGRHCCAFNPRAQRLCGLSSTDCRCVEFYHLAVHRVGDGAHASV